MTCLGAMRSNFNNHGRCASGISHDFVEFHMKFSNFIVPSFVWYIFRALCIEKFVVFRIVRIMEIIVVFRVEVCFWYMALKDFQLMDCNRNRCSVEEGMVCDRIVFLSEMLHVQRSLDWSTTSHENSQKNGRENPSTTFNPCFNPKSETVTIEKKTKQEVTG